MTEFTLQASTLIAVDCVRSNSEDNREAGWLISGLDFRAPSRPDSETAKKNTTRRQYWLRQVITYSVTAYVAIMCAIFQRPASGSSSIKYICMYIRSCVHTLWRQINANSVNLLLNLDMLNCERRNLEDQ